ncbi:MAG: hypothetical protein H0V84_07530 [Actinobacteria bacterium]|nr:hypothetical protein [Actinomycetota bacterium]
MWELIFLMAIMKIPIVYLCAVVWWAVRAVPPPPEPAIVPVEPVSGPELDAGRARPPRVRPRRNRPHGSPARGPARSRRLTVR